MKFCQVDGENGALQLIENVLYLRVGPTADNKPQWDTTIQDRISYDLENPPSKANIGTFVEAINDDD